MLRSTRVGRMDPYRSAEFEGLRDAPRDPGIVGEVISQFADPLAFYRELIQNSIDAGSPTIEIRLEYEAGAQLLHVIVKDRGEGMTRDIVENQLLVLFRSTKEHDRTKIGKFGIGFASVLAPQPDVVIIDTTLDGRRLTVHLGRDLAYELFDGGPATQTGTTVELEIPLGEDRLDGFVRDSRASLERWCRHASVPVELIATLPDRAPVRVRIDRPLSLDRALVEVRRTADGGELVAVVGITADAAPYTGFFNHGLMLHEVGESLAGRVAIKISDSRLGHTLSRDDVRRDAHFDRAVRFARELVAEPLQSAASVALRHAAEAGDLARHRQLVDAYLAAGLHRLSTWAFPLVSPVGDVRSIEVGALTDPVWVGRRSSPLTEALAARGTPVIHALDNAWLEIQIGLRLVEVERELTAVTPVERDDHDTALLAILGELLGEVLRAPELVLAHLHGRHADKIAIAGGETVVDHDEAGRNPFALLRRCPLVLNADHVHVAAARAAEPILGASHLARALLLHYRQLDADRSAAILEATLARVGVG